MILTFGLILFFSIHQLYSLLILNQQLNQETRLIKPRLNLVSLKLCFGKKH